MLPTAKMDEEEYDKLARSACFVCRIVEGNPLFPGVKIIYEDNQFVAFLNQFPTQEGYTIVCPKRHIERFESDMTAYEWSALQQKVQQVAAAVSKATDAVRMYVASLGTPDRNNHLHIHVCPCPPGLPIEKQELAAMEKPNGEYLVIDDARMEEIAQKIRTRLI